MRLSIVIPSYNEEKRIPVFLTKLIPQLKKDFGNQFEILVVDDGSKDCTAIVAEELLLDHGRVVTLPKNMGKGGAIKCGVNEAKGEYICITDADGSAGVENFKFALDTCISKKAYGVIGDRYGQSASKSVQLSAKRRFFGSLFVKMTRLALGLDYPDTQCGFKLFKSEVAKSIFAKCKIDGFGIDYEFLYLASQFGVKFESLPIEWNEVAGSKVNLWRHGLKMLVEMFTIRKMHANSIFFEGNLQLEPTIHFNGSHDSVDTNTEISSRTKKSS